MRRLIAALMMLNAVVMAKAQDMYVTANLSASHSFAENMRFGDLFTDIPGFNVGAGYNLARYGGVRLSIGYNRQAGRAPKALGKTYPELAKKYGFNTVGIYADALVNIFDFLPEPMPTDKYSLYFVAGGGLLCTSGFSSFLEDDVWKDNYRIKTESRVVPVVHAGFAGSLKLTSQLDLNLEIKINLASDRYNGRVRTTSLVDAFMDFNVGASWYFGRERGVKVVNRDKDIYDDTFSMDNALTSGNRLQTGISFLREYSEVNVGQRNNMKAIADYLKANPDVNAVIHAYADKVSKTQSGIERNTKLASERALSVYNKLINTYGIAEDRLAYEIHSTPLGGLRLQSGEMIRAIEIEVLK